MRRLAIVLEYDGTAYAGWQRQPNAPTVQAAVEDALASLLRAPHPIVGAGRTDAGVHALEQVAHVSTERSLPSSRVRDGLNALLPRDITVRHTVETASDFHARRDARLRVYRYAVLARPQPSALLRRYAHHVPQALDLETMRAAAAPLRGEHDFAAFRVTGTPTPSTTCTVRTLEIERRGSLLIITVAANRFLRQMVRRIVGALLAAGRGACAPEAIGAILASRQPQQAAPPAPAHGLYLVRVFYPAGRLGRPRDSDP